MTSFSVGEPEAAALAQRAGEMYRKLGWSLRWPLWRSSLRRQSHLLSLAGRMDEQVERLLVGARVRLIQEPEVPFQRVVRGLQARRLALTVTAQRRLGQALPLREALVQLEGAAWREEADRRLRQRSAWELAEALVPSRLPEVAIAAQGTQLLESRALLPGVREGQLPWSVAQLEALSQVLPPAEEALALLWQRVAALEPSGRLERFLRRMARSPRRERRTRSEPRQSSGAVTLVNGTFWCETARVRLAQALGQALPHLLLSSGEQLPVLRWLAGAAQSQLPALVPGGALSASRAALVEFTATWTALQQAPHREDQWPRLQNLADRMERLEGSEGRQVCESGREPLRRFVQLRAHGRMPLPREASLVGWVRSAWACSSGMEPPPVHRVAGSLRSERGDA